MNDWATRLVVGSGRRAEVLPEMAGMGSRRPLVVCSERFAAGPHLRDVLVDGADPVAGIFTDFDRSGSKATDEDVARIVEEFHAQGADGIVGIGGGFVMDAAKCALAALTDGVLARTEWPRRAGEPPGAAQGADRADVPRVAGDGPVQRSRGEAPVPLLVVPTTSGPGTETTGGASVRSARTNARIRVRDPRYIPRVAVLDPDLTVGLDAHVTVGTAVNAFAHCVESLYSSATNPLAQQLALSAAALIHANLERATAAPGDVPARAALQVASALAGLAMHNSYVCVHHALCHPLSLDAGVPHGTANFILLRHAMAFNLPAAEVPLARLGAALGILDRDRAGDAAGARGQWPTGADTVRGVGEWLDRFPLPRRLRDTGRVTADDLPRLAGAAFTDAPVRFNPRPVDAPDQLEGVYRAAW